MDSTKKIPPNLHPGAQLNLSSVSKSSLKTSPIVITIALLILLLLGFGFYRVLSGRNQVKKIAPQPASVLKSTSTASGLIASAPAENTKAPIQITGTIRFANLEGGCWSIEPKQTSCTGGKCPVSGLPNYQVINMPQVLKQAGIVATFSLEPQIGAATVCQTGPAVKILNYQISCTQDSDCPAGLVCGGLSGAQPSKAIPGVCVHPKTTPTNR